MDAKDEFKSKWDAASSDLAHSDATKDQYWFWTRKFFVFTGRRKSDTWTGKDWEQFERQLIVEKYSYSSRKTARSAINFIFRDVLKMNVGKLDLPLLPKPQPALVVVPTREELDLIFANLTGQVRLACKIMRGSGARVEECCRIRVQDVDLNLAKPMVRLWDGKGARNRVSVLPRNLMGPLRAQIERRRLLHEQDVEDGNGLVELPSVRKFRGQERGLGWQWLLTSSSVVDGHRWYVSPDTIGAKLRAARIKAGIVKRITPHSLRKLFANELMQAGVGIRTIQELLGHSSIEVTAVHYLAIDIQGAFSPADLPNEQLQREPSKVIQFTQPEARQLQAV